MKRFFTGLFPLVLTVAVCLSTLAGCGTQPAPETPPAPTEAVISDAVTITADGRLYNFENTAGKTVGQLLDEAGIRLEPGDLLSVPAQQRTGDCLNVQVLRQHSVAIVLASEDPQAPLSFNIAVMEGTVADALSAAGVTLSGEHRLNFPLDTPLHDGMQILVSGENAAPILPISEPVTEPTEAAADPTEPQSGRTVVNVETYWDCDGSGHGIKVITYSDGTQEEVLF